MADTPASLTRLESIVLSIVLRQQPVTAYRIRRTFAESIVSNFSTSAGTIYPLIRRLTQRGFLDATAVADSRRGAELLSCTARGEQAIREWVTRVEGEDLILEDPVRTKMAAMQVLAPEDRARWLRALRASLKGQQGELDAFHRANPDIPFRDWLHDNARATLAARLGWIDRTLKAMDANGEAAQAGDKPDATRVRR